jgi:hypothetical protein
VDVHLVASFDCALTPKNGTFLLQRKRLSKPRQVVEMGTQNADIDYDWIPKETIKEMSM